MFWKDDKSKMRVAASIMSADFAHLADEIKRVTDAGIEQVHIEVSDGVFLPNITVVAPVVKSLRKVTRRFAGRRRTQSRYASLHGRRTPL